MNNISPKKISTCPKAHQAPGNANQNHNETPLHTPMLKKPPKTSAGQDVGKLPLSHIAGRNVKWFSLCGEKLGGSQKVQHRTTV